MHPHPNAATRLIKHEWEGIGSQKIPSPVSVTTLEKFSWPGDFAKFKIKVKSAVDSPISAGMPEPTAPDSVDGRNFTVNDTRQTLRFDSGIPMRPHGPWISNSDACGIFALLVERMQKGVGAGIQPEAGLPIFGPACSRNRSDDHGYRALFWPSTTITA